MRPVGALCKTLSLAVAFAAFLQAAAVQAAPVQNEAVVRGVRGTANYSTDRGGNWRKLTVGTKLNRGTVIRTAPGSVVDLFLGDNGPVVRVTESTVLGLDNLSIDRTGTENIIETQLDLQAGRILGNVKRMAAASKYEVKTPQGVAGIRGTRYDISADGTVTILDGEAVVVYIVGGQPSTATVRTGQTALPPLEAGGPVRIMNADPAVLAEIRRGLDEAVITTVDEQVVIQTIEPIIEAIQGGDRAKNAPETPI